MESEGRLRRRQRRRKGAPAWDCSRALGRQDRSRHGAELYLLRLLQQPELSEVNGGQTGLRLGAGPALSGVGFSLISVSVQPPGHSLLRLAAYDLVACLDGAIREGTRIRETE